MATINPSGKWIGKGVHKTTWAGITATTDTVGWQTISGLPDKNVTIHGTFNAGTLKIQGSNDNGTTTYNLTDTQDAEITVTAAAVHTLLDNTEMVRPFMSAGSGANITVEMISTIAER